MPTMLNLTNAVHFDALCQSPTQHGEADLSSRVESSRVKPMAKEGVTIIWRCCLLQIDPTILLGEGCTPDKHSTIPEAQPKDWRGKGKDEADRNHDRQATKQSGTSQGRGSLGGV